MNIINMYNYSIYQLYKDLTNEDKLNNFDKLNKIFIYYSCINLSEKYNTIFYESLDISIDIKKKYDIINNNNKINAFNESDTAVYCSLDSNIVINFNELLIGNLQKFILSRDSKSTINKSLMNNKIIDNLYNINEFHKYCENILNNNFNNINTNYKNNSNYSNIKLRDYQTECIDLIHNTEDNNIIIKLPTGSGKNLIIIKSLIKDKKYLILVPRIVLLEQFKELLIKNGYTKKNIQCIYNSKTEYKSDKIITVCVYNSINKILNDINNFDKIYIDEGHHIYNYKDRKKSDNNINNNYIPVIQSFKSTNKLIYLSATIEEKNNDLLYEKSLNYMITNKYLTDYQIDIPLIYENDDNINNIANYIINNYFNIIVYCKTQEEGKLFTDILNNLINNCAKYIDSSTNKTDRVKILNSYYDGKIRFLINVKILTEGFDAPITHGIMFLHIPVTSNVIMQCIGRSLRNHDTKINAKIILPYLNEKSHNKIIDFINILSQNDIDCKKYKINMCVPIADEHYKGLVNLSKLLYDEIMVDKTTGWKKSLDKLELYILKNNKLPDINDSKKCIKALCTWIDNQKKCYKSRTRYMKYKSVRYIWNDFVKKYNV